MKAKQVLQLLRITRPTLSKYVQNGKLKVNTLPNGFYDYDSESVYAILNKNVSRKNVIYCRVSSKDKKKELKEQQDFLKDFISSQNATVDEIYLDMGGGFDFQRKDFNRLINDVIEHKISKVYITNESVLTPVSFVFFKNLLEKFNTEIVAVNGNNNGEHGEGFFTDVSLMVSKISEDCLSENQKKKLDIISSVAQI